MAKVSAELEVLEKIQAERRRLVEAGSRVARSAGGFERVALPNADADVLRDLLMAERATVVIDELSSGNVLSGSPVFRTPGITGGGAVWPQAAIEYARETGEEDPDLVGRGHSYSNLDDIRLRLTTLLSGTI